MRAGYGWGNRTGVMAEILSNVFSILPDFHAPRANVQSSFRSLERIATVTQKNKICDEAMNSE
jgi:hypothetical protein